MDAQNRSLFWSGHFPISRLMGLIPNSLWLTAQDNRRRATRPHWIHGHTSPLPHSSTKMCVWNQHKHLKVNTVTVSCSLSAYFQCEHILKSPLKLGTQGKSWGATPSHSPSPSLTTSWQPSWCQGWRAGQHQDDWSTLLSLETCNLRHVTAYGQKLSHLGQFLCTRADIEIYHGNELLNFYFRAILGDLVYHPLLSFGPCLLFTFLGLKFPSPFVIVLGLSMSSCLPSVPISLMSTFCFSWPVSFLSSRFQFLSTFPLPLHLFLLIYQTILLDQN